MIIVCLVAKKSKQDLVSNATEVAFKSIGGENTTSVVSLTFLKHFLFCI
jgi:hypothetical protein